jgi:peroxiredoxin
LLKKIKPEKEMKKIMLILAVAAMIMSCTGKKGTQYKISGIVKGVDTGLVYLQKMDTTGWISVDSVKLQKGEFTFKGKVESPDRWNIKLKGKDFLYPFYLENSNISMVVHSDSAVIEVKGSENQDTFNGYVKKNDSIQKLINALDPLFVKADSLKDTVTMNKLDDQYTVYDKGMKSIIVDFTKKHPTAAAAPWLILRNAYRFELPELDSLYKVLDTTLSHSFFYKSMGKRIATLKRVQIGNPAVDFTMSDTTGKPLTLSSLKGRILLVDFWASWCGPCRHENPNVVKAYAEFHGKGFDVLGVSFDRPNGKDKWEKAINDDHLTWNHVSDLQFWGNAAGKLYGINSIPANVLLDKDQKIIGKNLRGDALIAKLTELLGPPEVVKAKPVHKKK